MFSPRVDIFIYILLLCAGRMQDFFAKMLFNKRFKENVKHALKRCCPAVVFTAEKGHSTAYRFILKRLFPKQVLKSKNRVCKRKVNDKKEED